VGAQVWRWSQQYKSQVAGQPLPEMAQLAAWLEANVPAEDSDPGVTRISHGDYRCAPHCFCLLPCLSFCG
jgi:aminoglycoside phosphotransferase (APT) family kinase protein